MVSTTYTYLLPDEKVVALVEVVVAIAALTTIISATAASIASTAEYQHMRTNTSEELLANLSEEYLI